MLHVLPRNMCIDFVHCRVVFPTSDFGGYFFGYLQMIGKGRERMTQTMYADIRQIALFAYLFYAVAQRVLAIRHNGSFILSVAL